MNPALHGPKKAAKITPSDTVDLAKPCQFLMVNAAGEIVVLLEGDSASVTLPGLEPNRWHRMFVKRVLATGTDVGLTNIVAGWEQTP